MLFQVLPRTLCKLLALSDYIPVARVAESVSSLYADPGVAETDILVSVMKVDCVCPLAMTAFCINGYRVACFCEVSVVVGFACHGAIT